MVRYAFFRRALRSEHGSTVAQAAAVALVAAALISAMIMISPQLSSATERAFSCLAAAISGSGGGTCGGSGGSADSGGRSGESQPAEREDCGGLCQVGGFFKGLGSGAVDTVKGLVTLGGDAVKYALGDEETRAKYAALGQAIKDDPLGTGKAILGAMVEPMVEDWKAGRYGEAIGRGTFEVIATVVGDKGAGKLGKLGKVDNVVSGVARNGDEAAAVGGVGRRLPCVGSAVPGGRVRGLGAPLLAGDCDVPAMGGKYNRKAAGYKKPDLNDTNCVYCGQELTTEPRLTNSIEADHLVGLKDAWARGGKQWTAEEWKTFSNDLENLVASCKSCNASKQAKQLFDEWAPPNITPETRAELMRRIETIIEKYKLSDP